MIQRNIIFNPDGEKNIDKRKLIYGNSTNIIEINEIKYKWGYELYRLMGFTNFWIPQEIPMNDDRKQYEKELSESEKRGYEMVLSFLIVLDSYQVNILKELARYFTAPEIILALTSQEFQEGLHSFSYQYILESVVSPEKADEIYNYWREDNLLLERNRVIAELYNNFILNPNEENFIKAIIGDYILEALYFYSGFAFFYTLGRQGKMRNTVQQIKYINRDETTHVVLFRNIIKTLKKENPELFTSKIEKWIYDIFKFATEKEIEWGKYITQNQILGLSDTLIDKYIKYLSNLRLSEIGYKPLYEDITENPMKWIDEFRKINNTKTDFFQAKPQTYVKSNELKW